MTPKQETATPIKRYTFAVYGDCDHWMEESAGGTWISYEDHQRELAAAKSAEKRLHDLIDCACNALTDSICASGNDARTNLHWVKKLRAELAKARGE
jgi:hypothetical protein